MPRKPRTPSLRRHKPSGQAVVTLGGKDIYLGAWPAGQAKAPAPVLARYHRELSEWEARGRTPEPPPATAAGTPDGLAVAELIVSFLRHAEGYYRLPAGGPTNELGEFVLSLRPLNHLYGAHPADGLGPLKLKAVRELMVRGYAHPEHGEQAPLCRSLINKRVRRVVSAFRWGVSEELVSEATWQALKSVGGLKKGRSGARETAPVGPVSAEVVEKTLPRLNAHLRGVVRFQLWSGARPGEACGVRLADLDRSGPIWVYRPPQHKTTHQGKGRAIAVGPRGQLVLREFIRIRCPLCGVEGRPPRIGSRDGALCGPCADRADEAGLCGPWQRAECQPADAFLFSPATARAERDEDRRARRKSKVQPSQLDRKKADPKRRPGASFSRVAYAAAVYAACEKAGVAHWHAHQLRHTHATEVRRRFGLEAAQVALGHATADVTQVYAERDMALALKVAAEIG